MKNDDGQDLEKLLKELGLHGLIGLIAAALVEAEKSEEKRKQKLFHAIVTKICRAALDSGLDSKDLLDVSMKIMSIAHKENQRKLEQIKTDKYAAELASVENDLK